MKPDRSRLTYANVTATLALFVALGGGAYAAAKLPANSVGTDQIRDNAVISSKVLNGSLLAKDFKAGQLPVGPRGPSGPTGPTGAQGAPGGVNGLEVIYAASAGGPFVVKSSEAQCPAGKKVTGGGALIAGATNASVIASVPGQVPNPTSWYVEAREPQPSGASWTLYAYAVCATAQQ